VVAAGQPDGESVDVVLQTTLPTRQPRGPRCSEGTRLCLPLAADRPSEIQLCG